MATGAAWNIEEEAPDVPKPWANFDAEAVLDIPIDWTDWLADKETSYASHTITTHADLVCPSSSESAGVVKARIKKNPAGAALVIGTKYWFRCHIVAADGQEDEQTLWLKAVAK